MGCGNLQQKTVEVLGLENYLHNWKFSPPQEPEGQVEDGDHAPLQQEFAAPLLRGGGHHSGQV